MRRSYCFIVRDEERKERGGREDCMCSIATKICLDIVLKEFARLISE